MLLLFFPCVILNVHAQSVSTSSLPQFEISVSDPVKKSEGMSSYMLYTVNVKVYTLFVPLVCSFFDLVNKLAKKKKKKTSAANFKPLSSVQRRFNHFVWLFNELTNANPGIIVPPIPDKQAIGRFDSDLVDTRRIQFERFLQRVFATPALYTSSDLKIFVEADSIEQAVQKKIQLARKECFKKLFFIPLADRRQEEGKVQGWLLPEPHEQSYRCRCQHGPNLCQDPRA